MSNDASEKVATGAIESDVICALQIELAVSDDRSVVLDRFWEHVASIGTPLVESHDSANGTVLATFVWRGHPELRNVLLLEWTSGREFHEKQMQHLDGTDVWYKSLRLRDDLRSQYSFAPNDSMKSRAEETDWPSRFEQWRSDPFNRSPLVDPSAQNISDPRDAAVSIFALPNAPAQPWIVEQPNVERGAIEHHRFESTTLGNERDIWNYRPSKHPGEAPALVLTFDGEKHNDIMRQHISYDNLAASGRTLPFYGVMIGNVDRGNELPCNPSFLRMLTDELLPWLSQLLGATFAPDRTVVGGASYGGLAAMYAGLFASETFGNVLSQSGSFWWKPDPFNADLKLRVGDTADWAWLPSQASIMPIGNIAVWMEVGTLEDQSHQPTGPTQVSANHHMRDVLRARGVPVTYSEYAGGHDWASWRNSLIEGILALIPNR